MAELSESGTTSPIEPLKQTAGYRAALAAVILLGALIVIALAALVVGFAMRAGGHHGRVEGAVQIALAPRSRIVSADMSGDRLVLRVNGSQGEEIEIIDTETGRLVATVRTRPAPQRR